MKHLFFLLVALQLLALATAMYKQWIPNTNFETASNWDKGRIPCASDVVHFEKNKVISVFVRSPHALTDMYLPVNGEFVLASGAGFAAFDGSWDPSCDSGATVRFTDTEHHAWFDPTLWQTLSASRELEPSGLFAVDEERVPCWYDDVIFHPETSFRVSINSSQQVIRLRSISLMGQGLIDPPVVPRVEKLPVEDSGRGKYQWLSRMSLELSSPEAWARYLRGASAPLQFHGNATLQVTGTGCPDRSGCACGNAPDGHRICAALLRVAGGQCPAPACQSPLQPLGHCCKICGATINLDFTPDFDLQKYRDRLLQALLRQPKYAGVQMAISKVHKEQTFLGVIPRSSTPLIQIVLIDDGAGAQTGTTAKQLAADIMEDIAQHGEALGISSGKMEVATGITFSGQVGSHTLSRITAGTVLGLLFSLLFLGGILFLYRKGKLRLPALRIPWPWERAEDWASPEPTGDKGFDNPMFDVEPPSTVPGEETVQEMPPKDHQVLYLNPLYDPSKMEV